MLVAGLAVVALALPALAGATTKELHAQLTAIAPTHAGKGTFSATAATGTGTVQVKWSLSVNHLSGPATSATLQPSGSNGPAVPLCAPCGGHGSFSIVGRVWSQIAAGHAELVIATRAHPKGELHGVLKLG